MRLSAALLVVLLVVSAAAGVGVGSSIETGASSPAEIRASSPAEIETSSIAEVGGASALGADLPAADRTSASSALPTSPTVAAATSGAAGPTNETDQNVTVRDGTEMFVSLRKNGDARWNVSFRFVLHGRNETEAFRRLADRYRNGNAEVGRSQRTFERVVELAGSDTPRRMELRRANRSAQLLDNGSVGVLSLAFTWTNFTQTNPEANEIALGDVFWVDEQTWLPTLSDDQTLVIAGPDGYYISGASPSGGTINGTLLRYEGPQRFDGGDFSVTYSPKVAETASTTTTDGGVFSNVSGVVIVLLLFGFSFGAYALSQRRGADPDAVEEEEDDDDAPLRRSDDATEVAADEDEDAPRDEERADSDAVEEEDDEPATELLSDEERVLRLLEDNDGRMKQAQIVKETNWSNAKVSQLLSKMDDDDDVDKLRIGRENLITLPDENVTDTE